jgi:hypothetical protein
MKTTTVMSSLALLAPSALAQGDADTEGSTIVWPNLHFGLMYCDNGLEGYGWPDRTHEGSTNWNLIGMFPGGAPNITATTPNLYTLPQGGYPFHRYEGWNSSAFFWSDPAQFPNYPRGWLDIHIPASAHGSKSYVQAGTISFEGKEFNCQMENENLFTGGGTECRATNREFCAGYSHCAIRYTCRREKFPADKSCAGSQANTCYPSWDRDAGPVI